MKHRKLSSDQTTIIVERTHEPRRRALLIGVAYLQENLYDYGTYSDVYIGTVPPPAMNYKETKVAVKRLRFHEDEDIAKLSDEVHVWSKLDHTNILPLLGSTLDETTGYPYLVSPWMENGSSWDYVRAHPEADLMHLMTGAAEGLMYLHNQDVVHSDIKPENILVSDTGDALITDFGCARMVDASSSLADLSSGIKGTTRYLAYELLAVTNTRPSYTKESDVWAFGMTLYQFLALQRPYAGYEEEQVPMAIVVNEMLPPCHVPCPWKSLGLEQQNILWDICQSCWARDPSARPSMQTILNKLLELLSIQDVALTKKERSMSDLSSVTAKSSIVDSSPKGEADFLPEGEVVIYSPTPTLTQSSTIVEVPGCIPWGRIWARLQAMSFVRRQPKQVFKRMMESSDAG